jgi:hypothetical protein
MSAIDPPRPDAFALVTDSLVEGWRRMVFLMFRGPSARVGKWFAWGMIILMAGLLGGGGPGNFVSRQDASSYGRSMPEFDASLWLVLGAVVLLIIILVGFLGFIGFPFSNQIPAVARDVLKVAADTEAQVAARTSSLYLAQGVGALTAALVISTFSTLRHKGRLMTIGQFVFAASLVLVAFARTLPVALVLIAIMGWATVAQFMMMNTLIQIDVPDGLRGRVFSVYLWAQQGLAPFGSLFIGWLAQAGGVPLTAVVCGALCLLVLGFTHARWPVLRQKIV